MDNNAISLESLGVKPAKTPAEIAKNENSNKITSSNNLGKMSHEQLNITSIAKEDTSKSSNPVRNTLDNFYQMADKGIIKTKGTLKGKIIKKGKHELIERQYKNLLVRAKTNSSLKNRIIAINDDIESEPMLDGITSIEKHFAILVSLSERYKEYGKIDINSLFSKKQLEVMKTKSVPRSSKDASESIDKIVNKDSSESLIDVEEKPTDIPKDIINKQKKLEESSKKQNTDSDIQLEDLKKDNKKISFDDLAIDEDTNEEESFDDVYSNPISTIKDITPKEKEDTRDLEEILDHDKNSDILDSDDDEPTELKTDKEKEEEKKEFFENFNNWKKNIKDVLNIDNESDKITVTEKPVKISNALLKIKQSTLSYSFPLLYSGFPLELTPLFGEEILQMDPRNYDSKLNSLRTQFSIIYRHCVNAQKPSFDKWLEQIIAWDYPNITMAVYNSCFNQTNYVTYNCQNCNNIFLTTIPIEEMYDFPDSKIKERFDKISKSDSIIPPEYSSKILKIDENIAIKFKAPSLMSFFIEPNMLDQNFFEKYKSIIEDMPFIETIYSKNEFGTYDPVDLGYDKNDLVKTVKRKVKGIGRFLKMLNVDNRAKIKAEIENMGYILGGTLTFKIPEHKCPKCGNIIPNRPVQDPMELLFTRAQLANVASTIIE